MRRFTRWVGRQIRWLTIPVGIEHLGLLLAARPFGWQPQLGASAD